MLSPIGILLTGCVRGQAEADAARTLGFRRAVVDSAGDVRLARYVPAASDRVVALNALQEIVGYAYLADKDRAIVFEVGGAVVGGVLCNARLVERDDTGRIGSIFVRPAYRRQGLGHALMLTAFEAFWRDGKRRIILDTDCESFSDSTQLYRSLGMHPYRRELWVEKIIRAGKEVRRLIR